MSTLLSKRLFQIVVVVALLGGAAVGMLILMTTRPSAPKAEPTAGRETLVDIQPLSVTDHRAWIKGYGTVRSFQEVNVQTQVSGEVVSTSENLIAGGLFNKGEALFHIDPRDYEYAVEQQRASVATAQFDMDLEKGNKNVAQREWELLGPTIETNELGRSLALREPQMREREAALKAAESQLATSELNLERTVLYAPFNAVVIEEQVDVGQVVGPGVSVAHLVNTDEFHVQVSIPVGQLDQIRIPGPDGTPGSEARVIYDLGEGNRIERKGEVIRRLADVDTNGRLGRLLVAVKDPLDLTLPAAERKPLLLGAYVRVEIEGPILKDVFLLSRRSVREGDRVWVRNKQGELEFRAIDVLVGEDDQVVVRGELGNGDELIVSNLPAALPGMRVAAAPARPQSATAEAKPVSRPTPPSAAAPTQPKPAAPALIGPKRPEKGLAQTGDTLP